MRGLLTVVTTLTETCLNQSHLRCHCHYVGHSEEEVPPCCLLSLLKEHVHHALQLEHSLFPPTLSRGVAIGNQVGVDLQYVHIGKEHQQTASELSIHDIVQ